MLNTTLRRFLHSQPCSPGSRRSVQRDPETSLQKKVKLIKYDKELGQSFYCETYKYNLARKKFKPLNLSSDFDYPPTSSILAQKSKSSLTKPTFSALPSFTSPKTPTQSIIGTQAGASSRLFESGRQVDMTIHKIEALVRERPLICKSFGI